MSGRKILRGLKYTTILTCGGASAYYLHKNHWDLNSIGPVRFGRAAVAACKCVIDYKWSLYGLEHGSEEYQRTMSETHVRSATRLREMCCKNRGVFIKVGQHIGALEFLLPKEYVNVMKVLHSNAPQSPLSDIKQVIKEDLGQEADDLFKSFGEEPLGTASLAQVYKAELKDGRSIAIKVQHPNVRAHSVIDMATMEFLVHVVARLFPDFQFLWLAELTKKNLPLELDFSHEAKNCERIAHIFRDIPYVKVPSVEWNLTTERVLTMEFCEGGQVNDKKYMLEHEIDVNEVSKKLGRLYSEMIFKEGFVHCDPHPGNVLVRKNKIDSSVQIVLLDHGLYETLKDDFRLTYCKLWQSIIDQNIDGIKKYSQDLGTGDLFPLFACMLTARSWDAVTKGISKPGNTKISQEEDNEIRENVALYLPQIADVLNRVPLPMLLLFKTNDLLRGIETHLKTRANASSFITMSKCCIHAVYANERRLCKSQICRLKLVVEEYWKLFQISCYELYLWVRGNAVLTSRHTRGKLKETLENTNEDIEQ